MIAPAPRSLEVVVAGGGIAGVEAALALNAFAGPAMAVTVVDPGRRFRVPATATGAVFGIATDIDLRLPDVVTRAGAALLPGSVRAVAPDRHMLVLEGGRILTYDALVVAVGARAVPAVPGALTFAGAGDAVAVRGLVDEVGGRAARGAPAEVAVVVPPGCGWSLAAYELALMTREHLLARGGVRQPVLRVVTTEAAPLEVFGPDATAGVARMLERAAIEVVPEAAVLRWDAGRLVLADGREIVADRAIALPAHRGPGIDGLPLDAGGFIRADEGGRVAGLDDVWAVGDGTTVPVKQGGLACRQADVAASAIAGRLGLGDAAPAAPAHLDGWMWDGRRGRSLPSVEPDGETGLAPVWPVAKIGGRFLTPFLHGIVAARAAPGAVGVPV